MAGATSLMRERFGLISAAGICFQLLGGGFSLRVGSMSYADIITMEPGKRGGKPCIRRLRITVYDVLEYLASGMTLRTFCGIFRI